jgi:RNA polymerase sigma-70 factor (ECF subfamily)
MPMSTLGQELYHLAILRKGEELSDGALFERFLSARDEAAFEILIRRHGPMVMGVCRRVLHDEHLAEDAFQATFLILVRKAATIRRRESIGILARLLDRRSSRVAGRQKSLPLRN